MPDRFPSFTEDQSHEIAAAVNDLWKRVAILVVIIAVSIACGLAYGLHGISDARARGDAANRLALQVNRQLIRDANKRAFESRKAAAKSAKTAYAACRRQQESVVISREFFAVLRPALEAHNPPRRVAKLYADINAQHAFDVPKCVKPPKSP